MPVIAALVVAAHLLAARPPRCTPEGCLLLASIPLTGAGKAGSAPPPPPPPPPPSLDFSQASNSAYLTLF